MLSGPVPHDFGEAFRSIRTSLVAQLPGTGSRVVAVTSAQPLEGKTTTAVNIAMALAVGGARVLLIDADMRRPSVHKALRMPNDRGLSQLLAGQARMREVVQRTHDPNLLVHHRRPHAGEPVGAAGVRSDAGAARGPRDRPVRLDHHRHAAGAGRDRRGHPGAARRRA